MTHRVVRERIDPRLTASLFANYRNATDAILELVDIAVDSRLPGRALRVDYTIRPASGPVLALTERRRRSMRGSRSRQPHGAWAK